MSEPQKRYEVELDKYKATEKDYQKCVAAHQQLDSQLHENTMVIDELKRLEESAAVYKMIGPVLVKQDIDEAKQNVQKRIDYINGELKRQDAAIKDMEKKQEAQREVLSKLQHQLQQQMAKMAVKA